MVSRIVRNRLECVLLIAGMCVYDRIFCCWQECLLLLGVCSLLKCVLFSGGYVVARRSLCCWLLCELLTGVCVVV